METGPECPKHGHASSCARCNRTLCGNCPSGKTYEDVSLSDIDDNDIKRVCGPCMKILRKLWRAFFGWKRIVLKGLK